MLTNTIKIGKSNYTTDQFTTAVKTSSRFTEVADRLGLNKQMTPHIKGILTYIVKHNVDGCCETISKDTLIAIISM